MIDCAAVLILLCITALVLTIYPDYGSGFDEYVQDVYGNAILSWYGTLGQDKTALTYIDLFYYGGLFDVVAALAERISPVEIAATRHLLGALVGVAGLAGAWALARRLGGPVAGLCALLLLAAMPSWFGTMFINPKDVPFGAALVWAVYLAARLVETAPRPPFRLVAGFGIAAGAALAIRIGAVIVVAALASGLAAALVRLHGADWRALARDAALIALRIGAPAVVLAWGMMLVFWPYALIDPLRHPFDALGHFAELTRAGESDDNIDTLFFGQEISNDWRPGFYVPVHIAIKLPDVALPLILVAFLLAIAGLRRRGPAALDLRLVPVLFVAAFPIVWGLTTRPKLYDAERHFLFVLPLLAVLLGLAFSRLIAVLRARSAVAAIVAVLLFAAGLGVHVAELAELHPYEYTFYNQLVGGLSGATDRFETDYWAISLREALLALGARLRNNGLSPDRVYDVAICGNQEQVRADLPPFLRLVPAEAPADFYLSTTRHHCERDRDGAVLVAIGRRGVDFAVAKDLRSEPIETADRCRGGEACHGRSDIPPLE